jgi:hypothetical protein
MEAFRIYVLTRKSASAKATLLGRFRGKCVKDCAYWCKRVTEESILGSLPGSCGFSWKE